ncbi:uncharacterized protein [Salminus brasiliensis]|uniref:uncharacterized protein n=1 Tax=Salminus brasiliensis TaxID=930266 RepID=UPI003B833B58
MDTVIKRKKPELIRWLRGNDLILQYVDSEEILTTAEYTKLMSIKADDERNTKLLDMIYLKGPDVCSVFLRVLKRDKVNESSPELRKWISAVDTSGTSETSVAPGASAQSSANPNSSTSPAGNQRIADNEDFLKKNRSQLINKVKNVVGIVDDLLLTDEMASLVQAEPTDQARMRKVLDFTKSKKAAEVLIKALWKHAGDVMEDLTNEA